MLIKILIYFTGLSLASYLPARAKSLKLITMALKNASEMPVAVFIPVTIKKKVHILRHEIILN